MGAQLLSTTLNVNFKKTRKIEEYIREGRGGGADRGRTNETHKREISRKWEREKVKRQVQNIGSKTKSTG